MKITWISTGVTAEVDDSYALRLIEQGDAYPADDDTPITPTPDPVDPSDAATLIKDLQKETRAINTKITDLQKTEAHDMVFTSLYYTVSQAQNREAEDRLTTIEEQLQTLVNNEE